jgi:hypothetical protein
MPEQVIRALWEADRLLIEGAEVAEVARHLAISSPTYHRPGLRPWTRGRFVRGQSAT